MSHDFAVITPSYNQGPFIERTIASVLAQDVPMEYVIMDGGSTDQTAGVARRFADRLTFISERDRGQAHAVNKGLAATTAPIIAWINSDDVYYPGALARVRRFMAEHPDVDVVYGNAHHINERDEVIEDYPTESFSLDVLMQRCFICQPAAFFRRSVVERFGALGEHWQYVLDYEFWLRLAHRGARFAWVQSPLAGSRLHAATKTLSSRSKVHEEMLRMFREVFGRVPDRWLFNYAHARLGIDGSSQRQLGQLLLLAWESVSAAARHNGRVSGNMLRTLVQWLTPQAGSLLRRRDEERVIGLYADGWTSDAVLFRSAARAGQWGVEALLNLPGFVPHEQVELRLESGHRVLYTAMLRRGEELRLRQDVPPGDVLLRVTPVFCPREQGMGDDSRRLGVMCRELHVHLPGGQRRKAGAA